MSNKSHKMTNKSRKKKNRSRKMTNKSGKSNSLKKLKKNTILIGGQKFDFKDEHVEIDDSTITIDNNEVVVGLSFNNPEKIELFIFQNYTRDTGEQQKKRKERDS